MTTVTRHSETCTIKQVPANKTVEAVVHEFVENDKLVVILNKAVKIPMKWNGRIYEGRAAGMDFESAGPSLSKTQTSIRG
jgi:hypothetical protein